MPVPVGERAAGLSWAKCWMRAMALLTNFPRDSAIRLFLNSHTWRSSIVCELKLQYTNKSLSRLQLFNKVAEYTSNKIFARPQDTSLGLRGCVMATPPTRAVARRTRVLCTPLLSLPKLITHCRIKLYDNTPRLYILYTRCVCVCVFVPCCTRWTQRTLKKILFAKKKRKM